MNNGEYVVKVMNHGGPSDMRGENVDVYVYFADGSKYAATFFTMENLRRLFLKNQSTGECASGKYLWAANMIIATSLDDETINETITDLITTGEFARAFDGPHPIE